MTTDADLSFAEFQRTGSALALARVFDLLAPELLLLAGHLVRDAAAAEDLLQQTFLDAIQVAHRFDPRRGTVQRWLVGVLVNNAHKERRRRRRDVDPERIVAEAARHPVGEAAAHEFLAAVQVTMESLPPHYREVLRLGLLHGLDQAEIARALQRPAETVKTQLRRGMQHLRRGLPKGFALSVAVAFTAGQGIAAIRRTVVDGVPPPAGSTAYPAASPGSPAGNTPPAQVGHAGARAALSPVLGGVFAALLLGVVAFVLWPRGEGIAADPPAGPIAAGAAEPTRDPPAPVSGPRELREAPAPTTVLLLRARWSDGAPAAGVLVRARPAADASWLRELEARTDGAGSATFALPHAGAWRVHAARGGETTVQVAAGETRGELAIPSGVRVAGLVVDSANRPVVGATVYIAPASYALDGCAEVATTRADGTFAVRDVTPGRIISVTCEDAAPWRAHVVDGDELGGTYRFVLPKTATSLEGTVVAADGTPASGAVVLVARLSYGSLEGRMRTIPWRLRADAQGRFRAAGVPVHERLLVWARTERSAASVQYVELSAAARIDIRLRRGATVSGRVIDAAGVAVAGAAVAALQGECEEASSLQHPLPEWARVRATTGPDGSFVLAHVLPGSAALVASADGRGIAREAVTLADGEDRRWNAALATDADLLGVVVGDDGTPLPNMEVHRRDERNDSPVARTQTNAAGRFRFRDCGVEPQGLLVAEPAAAFWTPALRLAVTPGPVVRRIVVPDSRRATAALDLRPLDWQGGALDAGGLRLLMARIEGGTLQIGEGRADVVPGGWRVSPLVPGTYDLVLAHMDAGNLFVGRFELLPGATADAGEMRFEQPGHVEVVVRESAGGRPGTGMVGFIDPRAPFAASYARLTGGVARDLLQPGHWLLSAWSEDLPMICRELTVEAGGRHHLEVVVPPTVRRRVVFAGVRTPLTFLHVTCFDAAGTRVLDYPCSRTGRGAEVVTRAFVPGSYELVVRDLAGRERRSSFRISPDAEGEEVVEVVPPE